MTRYSNALSHTLKFMPTTQRPIARDEIKRLFKAMIDDTKIDADSPEMTLENLKDMVDEL